MNFDELLKILSDKDENDTISNILTALNLIKDSLLELETDCSEKGALAGKDLDFKKVQEIAEFKNYLRKNIDCIDYLNSSFSNEKNDINEDYIELKSDNFIDILKNNSLNNFFVKKIIINNTEIDNSLGDWSELFINLIFFATNLDKFSLYTKFINDKNLNNFKFGFYDKDFKENDEIYNLDYFDIRFVYDRNFNEIKNDLLELFEFFNITNTYVYYLKKL